jgi:hypothetical protein
MAVAKLAWDFVRSDLVGSVVRFPLWWYGDGLKRTASGLVEGVRIRARQLGLSVWWKNLFVPMYGVRDWEGRIISVVMRTAVLVARSFAFVVEVAAYALVFAVYLALPALAAVMLVRAAVLPALPMLDL